VKTFTNLIQTLPVDAHYSFDYVSSRTEFCYFFKYEKI